jgi:hypothetical protein
MITSRGESHMGRHSVFDLATAVAAFLAGCAAPMLALDRPVPGVADCYYQGAGDDRVWCAHEDSQRRYDQMKAEAWRSRWIGVAPIEIERDTVFSLLQPEVRTLSDGSQMWVYREGGGCSQELANSGALVAHSIAQTGAAMARSNGVRCSTQPQLGGGVETNCTTPPPDPGPAPAPVYAQICKPPRRITQFFIRDGKVYDARVAEKDLAASPIPLHPGRCRTRVSERRGTAGHSAMPARQQGGGEQRGPPVLSGASSGRSPRSVAIG